MTPDRVCESLPKSERLCGKTAVSSLFEHGRWGGTAHLRYCWRLREASDAGDRCRVMFSVPKKFFKRAVRRNLLKRRLREAYRTQKPLLECSRADILFSYGSKELCDYAALREEVAQILSRISRLASEPARSGSEDASA